MSEAAGWFSIPMKLLANWVCAAKAGGLRKVGQQQKPLTRNVGVNFFQPASGTPSSGNPVRPQPKFVFGLPRYARMTPPFLSQRSNADNRAPVTGEASMIHKDFT